MLCLYKALKIHHGDFQLVQSLVKRLNFDFNISSSEVTAVESKNVNTDFFCQKFSCDSRKPKQIRIRNYFNDKKLKKRGLAKHNG